MDLKVFKHTKISESQMPSYWDPSGDKLALP